VKTAIVTVDLGFGDAGKGQTVDKLCREYGCDLVVRYSGGHQAKHNVVLPDGHVHGFSQFGSGTFAGVRTHLGPAMIISPTAIQREAAALTKYLGKSQMGQLTIDSRCLVTTPIHTMMNRIVESTVGSRHGSCGVGVGETRRYWLDYGQDAIFAKDLTDRYILANKLELLRERMLRRVVDGDMYVPDAYDFSEISDKCAADNLQEAGQGMQVGNAIPSHNLAIYEASQGVLLDQTYGLQPHTTWSDVTMRPASEMMIGQGYQKIVRLGITRAYGVRHGKGPLPAYSVDLTSFCADTGNQSNMWQGDMRMGCLNMDLVAYAAKVCGSKLDGLVVNHLDQLEGYSEKGNELRYVEQDAVDSLSKYWEKVMPMQVRRELSQLLHNDDRRTTTTAQGLVDRLAEIAPIFMTARGRLSSDRQLTELADKLLPPADYPSPGKANREQVPAVV
jgi:adenylosuccinate synthase